MEGTRAARLVAPQSHSRPTPRLHRARLCHNPRGGGGASALENPAR